MTSYLSNFKEFLKNRTVQNHEKSITHVNFNGGKYHIPLEENEEFLSLYLGVINEGHPQYIGECLLPGKQLRFAADIEIRKHFRITNISDKEIENVYIPFIVQKLIGIIKKKTLFDQVEHILSKRAPYLAHINFPKVILTMNEAKEIIIELQNIMNEYYPEINWEKSLDSGIYCAGKGLRLLGSYAKKDLEEGENPVYNVVNENGEYVPITLEQLKETSIRTEIDDPNLDVILSRYDSKHILNEEEISNTDDIISSYIEEIRPEFKEHGLRIHSIKKITYPGSPFPCFAVNLKDTNCPFIQRQHKRKSFPLYLWITREGSCLKCYDDDCSPNKYPEKYIKLNTTIKNKYYMGLESKSSKSDFIPEGYELVPELIEKIEDCLIGGNTHFDIANLVYYLYKDRFRVDDHGNRATWYEFKNHRFYSYSNHLSLLISSDLVYYFLKYKQEICGGKNESIDDLIKKLKSLNFKNNIVTEAANIFYHHHQNFIDLMDSKTHLICFNNGVLDLDTFEFRDGHIDDYITLSTRNPYIEYDEDNPKIQEIYKFFRELFPDEQVTEYQLKKIALGLHGKCQEEFNIWTGNGSNGKSKCCQLIQNSFGDYWCESPVSLITKPRNNSSSPSPEIMDLKGRRIVTLQEPESKDRLNMGLIKQFTGNDYISARQLHKKQEKFRLQAKLFLCCNVVPRIEASDGGTWRRIKVVEFTSKFIWDPKKDHEFKIDPELESKIKTWGPYFLSILVHYYKKIKSEDIIEPFKVKEFTKEIRRDYDIFSQFIEEALLDDKDALTPLGDIQAHFDLWCEQNSIRTKLYTKHEIKKYLSDIYGREKTCKVGNEYVKGFNVSLISINKEALLLDDDE